MDVNGHAPRSLTWTMDYAVISFFVCVIFVYFLYSFRDALDFWLEICLEIIRFLCVSLNLIPSFLSLHGMSFRVDNVRPEIPTSIYFRQWNLCASSAWPSTQWNGVICGDNRSFLVSPSPSFFQSAPIERLAISPVSRDDYQGREPENQLWKKGSTKKKMFFDREETKKPKNTSTKFFFFFVF